MAEKKENKTGFFQGVKAEFGKISWPSRETLLKKTGLVVAITLVLGVLISIVDSAALWLFQFLI